MTKKPEALPILISLMALVAVAPHDLLAATKHHASKKEAPAPIVMAASSGKKFGPPVAEVDISGIFDKQDKKPVRRRLNRAPEAIKLDLSDKPGEKLFEDINRARLALAQNNLMSSLQHLKEAQDDNAALDSDGDNIEKTDIQTGHFIFYHGKHIAYHYYFPLNTELSELNGPEDTQYWSQNGGIGVKDVTLVNITVTFNVSETGKQLAGAVQAVQQFKNDEAQTILTKLVESSSTITSSQKLPLIKARDNIMLTRYFIDAKSYDAARLALRHARDGLNDASNDKRYQNNKDEIKAMGRDIVVISKDVASKDPTFMGQTAVTLENWWNNLGDLSDEQDADKSETAIINAIRQSE